VVRVLGCRIRGLGFDSGLYLIFRVAVCLKWGPLGVVAINEELLERKVAAPVKLRLTAVGVRRADHTTSVYPPK
jgi:hypothetical protein